MMHLLRFRSWVSAANILESRFHSQRLICLALICMLIYNWNSYYFNWKSLALYIIIQLMKWNLCMHNMCLINSLQRNKTNCRKPKFYLFKYQQVFREKKTFLSIPNLILMKYTNVITYLNCVICEHRFWNPHEPKQQWKTVDIN